MVSVFFDSVKIRWRLQIRWKNVLSHSYILKNWKFFRQYVYAPDCENVFICIYQDLDNRYVVNTKYHHICILGIFAGKLYCACIWARWGTRARPWTKAGSRTKNILLWWEFNFFKYYADVNFSVKSILH